MSGFGNQLRAIAYDVDAAVDGLTAALDEMTAERDQALAELAACQSPFELLFEETWEGGIDLTRWFVSGGTKFAKSHATIVDGKLRLEVREDADGVWRGGLVGLREPQTYGKYEVDCYLEAGSFRGVALLWPKSEVWPEDGEVDFFEIGAEDPERVTNTQTFHYGSNPNHPMIHTSYGDVRPFSEQHTVGVEWTPERLGYTCDGIERLWVNDPAVPSWPMKPHVQSARPGASIEPSEGAYVVEAIRVYSWKGVAAS